MQVIDNYQIGRYNEIPVFARERTGRPVAVSTSLKKGVILMSNGLILLLLDLIGQGALSSVTVTKDTVTIRIKK